VFINLLDNNSFVTIVILILYFIKIFEKRIFKGTSSRVIKNALLFSITNSHDSALNIIPNKIFLKHLK